nr:hypothetical protein BaRGS_004757 [Batillaria attramentaria]
MPFGQIPALYDDDFLLVQSNAILRYLARKHDLYGSGVKSAALIDQLNDGVEDVRCAYTKLIYMNYDNGKAEYIQKLPANLQPFENLLAASKAGETGAAVDGKLYLFSLFFYLKISFVDYNLFDLLDIHSVLAPGCLDAFPTLKAYYNKMAARPKIAAYRETEAFKSQKINGNGKQ